jgi:F5/8 type C domain.
MSNIPLTGQVSASSFIAPFQAARAVDGISKPADRWVGEVPCTLNFTPNGLYIVNRWVVSGMASLGWDATQYYLMTYSLQGSNDNKNWVTLDTVDNSNTSTIIYSSDRTFNPTAAYMYYRVNVTKGLKCNPGIASIANFQLYPVDPTSPYLSGLSLSNGTLTPPFSKNVYTYNSSVDYGTTSVTVTPVAETPTAYGQNVVIKVNGVSTNSGTGVSVNLAVGNNTINIDVTSAVGGLIQRYTVNVLRQNSNKLLNLSVLNGSTVIPLTQSFDKNTYVYTANVDMTVQGVMINATKEDGAAQITINGSPATSGQPFGPIVLGTGDTPVNIVVSTPTTGSQTYTVTIKRNEDLFLSSLQIANVSPLTLTPTFSKNTFSYTASSGKVSSLKVKPTADNPSGVTLRVNGVTVSSGAITTVNVTSGQTNEINVTVTSNTTGQFVQYTCSVAVSN